MKTNAQQSLAVTCMIVVLAMVPLCATAAADDTDEIVLPAPSIWPMFHHDVRRSSVSVFSTLTNPGSEKWSSQVGGSVQSSPAIDSDGTIYVGSSSDVGNFSAVNPDGTIKWQLTTGGPTEFASPAIAADHTVYVGADDGTVYAINPNGSFKWTFPAAIGSRIQSSPAIASDGTIYIGAEDGNFYAINPNGTLKWAISVGAPVSRESPAIANDGTIYLSTNNGTLLAILDQGAFSAEKWQFATNGTNFSSSPAVATDGTIYIGANVPRLPNTAKDFNLYAIRPDGTLKWKLKTGSFVQSTAAIAPDGTIYVGSEDDNLYAIKPDGMKKWKFKTGGAIESSPAISADGTIYVGSDDSHLYAVNPNGSLKWKFLADAGFRVVSSPAIGADGTVYVGSDDGSLYALGLPISPFSSVFLTLEGFGTDLGTQGYYQTVDPQSLRPTLGAWWGTNGFDPSTGIGVGETRTAYLNNNDLGFGRDMHCRQNGSNVACYVTNYGNPDQDPNNANLALKADKSKAKATVAMEYSAIEGQPNRIVKFFVFNGGQSTAIRVTSADLDGFGEKFVPQLCLNCHGGVYSPKGLIPSLKEVDMGSSFREFDLASFKYPMFRARPLQEQSFKKLNAIVRATNPSAAIKELIDGWYSPNRMTQNSSFVPNGWMKDLNGVKSHPIQNLYKVVVAGSCRTCHVALDSVNSNSSISWATYAQFQQSRNAILSFVCDPSSREMPHALVTFKNFWLTPNRPATLAAFSDGTNWPAFGGCK